MKYLATLVVLSFFSCSGRPVAKGYYSASIHDTTKYVGHMHYSDNFKHDTSFSDTILVIHSAKDSIIFWNPDFYLQEEPFLFEYKRVYTDFEINSDDHYVISSSGRLTTWDLSFRFYDNNKLSVKQKKTAKSLGVLGRMQEFVFEGTLYVPQTPTKTN